jgi:fatty-acyl-CoA synthase
MISRKEALNHEKLKTINNNLRSYKCGARRKGKEQRAMEGSTVTAEQTMGEALERIAKRFPDKEALVFGEARVTFRQLDDQVNILVPQLKDLDLSKGDRVGIMLLPCPEIVYVALALAKIGAVTVLVNPMLQAGETEYLLADAGISALVVMSEFMKRDYHKMVEEIRPNLPALRHVILKGAKGNGALSLEEMLAAAKPAPQDSFVTKGLSPHDLCTIFYTGGTTGLPKGVMASSYKILYADSVFGKGLSERDAMLMVAPLYLTAGFITLAPALLYGMKLVGLPSFDPRIILQLIQDEKITYMFAYPTMMRMILGLPMFDQYDVSSMRLMALGGEPVTVDLVKEVQKRFSCQTITGYGSTEANPITTTRLDDPPELVSDSDGCPIPGMEIKLVDDEHQEVPFGEVGEVAARGPSVFKGYWNRPEVNAQVIDEEGWFYTGDLARMINEDGYIRFVGREKETIRRGAMTIYPEEVENYLRTNPKIANVAIIGVPSEVAGERVRAYVQLREGTEMTPAEVVDYCRHQIATYKLPDEVRFVSSLPLTPQRRVQRFKLREQAREELKGTS